MAGDTQWAPSLVREADKKLNGTTLWSALSGRKEQRTMDSQRNEHLTQAGVSEASKATGRSHLTGAVKNLYLSHLSLEAWRIAFQEGKQQEQRPSLRSKAQTQITG